MLNIKRTWADIFPMSGHMEWVSHNCDHLWSFVSSKFCFV